MIKRFLRKKLNHDLFDSRICIVSGIGRSGTTILRKSLEVHQEINSTKTENNFVYDLLEGLDMSVNKRFNAIKTPIEEHFRVLKNTILDVTFPNSRNLSKVNALCSDLRVPSYRRLSDLFGSKIKVVYILRNGIEVIASRMLKPQFKHFSFEENCKIWAYSKNVLEFACNDKNFLLIRHEDMLKDNSLEVVYKEIFSHLNIASDSACVEFVKKNFCHPTNINEEDLKINSLQSRFKRWESFDSSQKKIFNRICGDAMAFFEYKIPLH